MTDTLAGQPEPIPGPASSDAGLDASQADDRTYLHQLGYRQELRRALGLFSSFAVQFTCIAVAGASAQPKRRFGADRPGDVLRMADRGRVTNGRRASDR